MNKSRALIATTLLISLSISLSGCGKDGLGGKDKNDTDKAAAKAVGLDGRWTVLEKTCNEQPLPIAAGEQYDFKSAFMAKIITTEDNTVHSCKSAIAFSRVLTTSTYTEINGGGEIHEAFIMTPTNTRVACYKKTNGTADPNPYRDETRNVNGTEAEATLIARSNNMTMNVKNSAECRQGQMTLKLERR